VELIARRDLTRFQSKEESIPMNPRNGRKW